MGASSSLSMWEGSSLEVGNESWKAGCLNSVLRGVEGILDEGELSGNLVELGGDAVMVVVIAVVAFDLSDHIPIVEI